MNIASLFVIKAEQLGDPKKGRGWTFDITAAQRWDTVAKAQRALRRIQRVVSGPVAVVEVDE